MTTLLSLKNLLRVASSMALLALICTPVHGQWTKGNGALVHTNAPLPNNDSDSQVQDVPL